MGNNLPEVRFEMWIFRQIGFPEKHLIQNRLNTGYHIAEKRKEVVDDTVHTACDFRFFAAPLIGRSTQDQFPDREQVVGHDVNTQTATEGMAEVDGFFHIDGFQERGNESGIVRHSPTGIGIIAFSESGQIEDYRFPCS